MTIRWPFKRLWASRMAKQIASDIHARLDRATTFADVAKRQDEAAEMLARLEALAAEQSLRKRSGPTS